MSQYLSDLATEVDLLDFEAFRDALQEVVETADTPLTVGVFGPWGSGKTSLMRMVRKQVEAGGLARVRTVWFTAWKYDRQEALWRSLILRVLEALHPDVPEEKQTAHEKKLVQ